LLGWPGFGSWLIDKGMARGVGAGAIQGHRERAEPATRWCTKAALGFLPEQACSVDRSSCKTFDPGSNTWQIMCKDGRGAVCALSEASGAGRGPCRAAVAAAASALSASASARLESTRRHTALSLRTSKLEAVAVWLTRDAQCENRQLTKRQACPRQRRRQRHHRLEMPAPAAAEGAGLPC